MQVGSEGTVIPVPVLGPEQSHPGGQGKFDFYCSKGHKLLYLLTFYVKFSAVWGIFDSIRAHEIITICDFLAS